MNSTYNILTPGFISAQCQLTVFINNLGVSYLVLNANNVCVALAVYHFDAGTTTEQMAHHLKEIAGEQFILQQAFKKINFIYGFPESVLIPHQFLTISTNKELLELVHSDTSSAVIKTDFIISNNLHNIFCVPESIDNIIEQLFPKAHHCHLYSLLQNITQTDENQLYCIIYENNIIVQLVKEGQFQMVQTFGYSTPEEVSYYLLSLCKSFDVPNLKTPVYINGIIDEDAMLLLELRRYFQIQYGGLPKGMIVNDEIKKYPEHYFNHLFELSTCV